MKKSQKYYLAWAVLVALYMWLSLTAPVNPAAKFQFSPGQRVAVLLSLIVPLALIWLSAAFGISRFKHYARGIIGSPDGKALNQVANGLVVLAYGFMVMTVIGTQRIAALGGGYIVPFNRLFNYVYVTVYLVGFYLIFRGSHKLIAITKSDQDQVKALRKSLVPMTLVAALYAWGFRSNPYLSTTPDPANVQSYYLTPGLVLLTLVFPYLLAWCLGVMAVVNIRLYLENVKGSIYRQALKNLANGIFAVVVFSIMIQLLTGLSVFFQKQGLAIILGIVYLIILAYAVGYLLIATGARKLRRIEEIT